MKIRLPEDRLIFIIGILYWWDDIFILKRTPGLWKREEILEPKLMTLDYAAPWKIQGNTLFTLSLLLLVRWFLIIPHYRRVYSSLNTLHHSSKQFISHIDGSTRVCLFWMICGCRCQSSLRSEYFRFSSIWSALWILMTWCFSTKASVSKRAVYTPMPLLIHVFINLDSL